MLIGQQFTKSTYEDPTVVDSFIKRNSLNPKQTELIKSFAKTIEGKRVLDLGCGPGQDSYLFAELGFEVTGLDYSAEMIRRAKIFRQIANQPRFVEGDMRHLTDYFAENSFDAIWASASLLHIQPEDLSQVLRGMTAVARNGAAVYVGLKGGSGTIVVDEDKFGKPTKREFTLWDKASFIKQTKPYG